MNAAPFPTDADRDQRLADLLTDLSEQARQGRDPDIDAAAARHPELSRELRELWAAVQMTEAFTPRLPLTPDPSPPRGEGGGFNAPLPLGERGRGEGARSARNVPSLRPRPPSRAASAITSYSKRSAAAAWASSTGRGNGACIAPSP